MDRLQEYGLELILDTMLKMYEDKGGKLPISKEQLLRFLKFFVSVDMDQQRQVLEGNARSIYRFFQDEIEHEQPGMYYDRFNDHFNLMNVENMLTKGEGWKPRDIYAFQDNEVKVLEENFHEETYKRIRRNSLHLIDFKNYEKLVEILKAEISEDDLENQSVRLYKLEKRFNLEIIKTILKAKNQIEKMILEDLILVMMIPDIEGRHEYVELYQTMLEQIALVWRNQILNLVVILSETISRFKDTYPPPKGFGSRDDIPHPERHIYREGRYMSESKFEEDFDESDFKDLMEEIKRINSEVLERHKRGRGRPRNDE
ncbi:MAG: hypothetical protein WBJ15_01605 [Limnochordia bacterium]